MNAPNGPTVSDAEIIVAGLEIRRGFGSDQVWGWRTCTSKHCHNHGGEHNVYLPGEYRPLYPLDVSDKGCASGIYLAGRDWLWVAYGPWIALVRCYTRRDDMHRAGCKWRTRRLVVVGP